MLPRITSRFLTGFLIVLIGVLALLDRRLLVANDLPWFWLPVMAAAALAYGWIYLRSHEVGAAVGAYVCAAIALTILVVTLNVLSGVIVPVLVLVFIGAPFLYFGLRSAEQRALLIPAYVMFVIALMILLVDTGTMAGEMVAPYTLAAIGLPFIVGAYLRQERALLIPAAVMLILSLFLLGSFAGLGTELLTIGLPLLLIVIGAGLLLRPGRDSRRKRHEI